MNEQIESTTTATDRRGRCSVDGCPCKDVRIVLRRRAAFYADLAVRRGETADRIVMPDPAWILPSPAA
jgi:hypothetical protein